MSDAVIARTVDYAAALDFGRLPEAVVHEVKRRLIDTLGCAVAGSDEPASSISRALALRPGSSGSTGGPGSSGSTGGPGSASILGTARRSLPELAAFANGVAARSLDGNDPKSVSWRDATIG
jgi:2-methylcitrate dehydratase